MDNERPFPGNLRKPAACLLIVLPDSGNLFISGKAPVLPHARNLQRKPHEETRAHACRAGSPARTRRYRRRPFQTRDDGRRRRKREGRGTRLQTNNANARYQLGELRRNQDSIAARARSRQLEQYQIDQIDFSKTEVSEAIIALGMLIEKKSEGKFSPNFMIQDPSNKLADREVTLQVKNLPARAALNMILAQAGASARFEKHAIIIVPRPSTSTGGEPPSQPVKKAKTDKGGKAGE